MSYRKYALKSTVMVRTKNPTFKQLKKILSDRKRAKRNRVFVNAEIEKRGCCQFCKNIFHRKVYQWHHIWDDDPTNIKISDMISRSSVERIAKEFKKVVLVCPNCHVTFHSDLCCMIDHRKESDDGTYYNSYISPDNKEIKNLKVQVSLLDFF